MAEAPPAYQPSPSPSPPPLPKLPPKVNEVEFAIRRVFKDAAILHEGRQPNFVVGDFNGDESQDVAMILKPVAGNIDRLNEEYPPWILKDLLSNKRARTPVMHIDENELLLAIIHGYGANDWRDSQATQTHLLKNAAGSELKAHPHMAFKEANAGRKLPRLHGDLIGQTLRGTLGYLYYTGATYSWYDPKTFKGEPEKRFVHGGSVMRTRN